MHLSHIEPYFDLFWSDFWSHHISFCGLRSSKDWRFGDVLPESPETGHGWSLRWCKHASWPHGPCHKAWFILVLWLLAKEYKHFAQLVGNTTLEPMVRGAIDRAIAKAWSFICSAVTHWMIDATCSFSGLGYAECDLGANWKRGVPCLNMLRFASAIRPKTSQHSQRMTVTCSHHM